MKNCLCQLSPRIAKVGRGVFVPLAQKSAGWRFLLEGNIWDRFNKVNVVTPNKGAEQWLYGLLDFSWMLNFISLVFGGFLCIGYSWILILHPWDCAETIRKTGVPPVIIHFWLGFFIIFHPFWVPLFYGNTQILEFRKCSKTFLNPLNPPIQKLFNGNPTENM